MRVKNGSVEVEDDGEEGDRVAIGDINGDEAMTSKRGGLEEEVRL